MRFTVATTRLKMVFTVSHLQLPFRSFFRKTGLLLNAESSMLKGCNTWLMVCWSVHITL